MDNKDKAFEIEAKGFGVEGKLRFENTDNRVVAKIGDALIDKLSWFRWNRAIKFYDKYTEMKTKRNIVGKEVPLPPKFLIEILGNAFIEENDDLQELWIKLLVNWEDSSRNLDKRQVYLDILKSLSATEVKILDLIYKQNLSERLMKEKDLRIPRENIMQILNISKEDYDISMANLFRCGCCESYKEERTGVSMAGLHPTKDYGIEAFKITFMGHNLILNCISD